MDGIRKRMSFLVVIILVVVGSTSALDCHSCSGDGCLKSESWLVEKDCPSACYVLYDPKDDTKIYARRCYTRKDDFLDTGFMSINNSENAEAPPDSLAPLFEKIVRVQEHPAAVVEAWICNTQYCNGDTIAEARKRAEKLGLVQPCSGGSAKLAQSSGISELRAGFVWIGGMVAIVLSNRL